MKAVFGLLTILLAIAIGSILLNPPAIAIDMKKGADLKKTIPTEQDNIERAILAGGCFWCLESEIRRLDGVIFTQSGYIGGHIQNPTYDQITTGRTGHAEAVEIYFNPEKISYRDILIFFLTEGHDPTQLNRQWVDVGTQYRSGIFYLTDDQKTIAETLIQELNNQKLYPEPIVTEITKADKFWVAEDYHQQFYEEYEKKTGSQHRRIFFKAQEKEKRKTRMNKEFLE